MKNLPVRPPVAPMLAKAAKTLPEGDGFAFEPKWDGFRCIVFRDGADVVLGSRNERPLTRYFPELVDPIREQWPDRVVVDGEIVIATPTDSTSGAQPPASGRVACAEAGGRDAGVVRGLRPVGPGDTDARPLPLSDRWRLLVDIMEGVEPPLYLTPSTRDIDVARDWFTRFEGAGLDGVVAKRLDTTYRESERVHIKVKHERTADCVVAGFRWHKSGGIIGSLLLGLFDDEGTLHHVGVIGAFTMDMRRRLVDELAPLRTNALEAHPWRQWAEAAAHEGGQRLPGATSRWNAGKDLSWEPLRTERVIEVAYDQLQGDRFRHAAQFRRWRPDRTTDTCRYSQLESIVPEELAPVFGRSFSLWLSSSSPVAAAGSASCRPSSWPSGATTCSPRCATWPGPKRSSGASDASLAMEVGPLDVTDQASVDLCIQHVLETAGRIDVLINNAGIGTLAAVEDYAVEEIQHVFDTNFLGALRMMKAVP